MLSVKHGGIKYLFYFIYLFILFYVFGMTQPRIESRSSRPLANTLLIKAMKRNFLKLLVLDSDSWNHLKLFKLDNNIWNKVSAEKY